MPGSVHKKKPPRHNMIHPKPKEGPGRIIIRGLRKDGGERIREKKKELSRL